MPRAECFCGRYGYRHDVMGGTIPTEEHTRVTLPSGFEVCTRCVDPHGYLELWTHAHPEGAPS